MAGSLSDAGFTTLDIAACSPTLYGGCSALGGISGLKTRPGEIGGWVYPIAGMVGGHTCGDPKRRSKDMRSLLHHLSGVGAERLGCNSPRRDAESAGAGDLPVRLLCLLKLLRHNLDQLLKLDELCRHVLD